MAMGAHTDMATRTRPMMTPTPTSRTGTSMFDPDAHRRSARHARIYAACEIAYTAVDFLAALLFVIGSVLFFWASTETLAIWLFIFGSLCFALKPTIRLSREIAYWRAGKFDDLARRADE